MITAPFQIRVGENGRRCGLAVAADGDLELRILVLPKVWQPKEKPPLYWQSEQHGKLCVSVACWEGNRLRLDQIKLERKHRKHLASCVLKITKKAQQHIEEEIEAVRKKHAESGGDDALLEEGVAPTALVRLDAGRDSCFVRPSLGPPSLKESRFETYWDEFYGLWYFSRRHRSEYDSTRWIQIWESLGAISGSRVSQVLLVPFLHHAFVTVVESLLRDIRPGYTRVTALSTFVRGRIDVVSAAIVAEDGGTQCRCTFDVFGLDSPITQVIAAALRVVCKYAGNVRQFPNTTAKAQWLAGHFQGVSALGAAQARRQGMALRGRLSKSDMAWRSTLDMACDVLDRHIGLSPSAGPHAGPFGWSRRGDEGFVFDIDTATIWQKIVQAAWPCTAEPFPDTVHPWMPSSGKLGRGMAADDVRHIEKEKRVSIVDSKYKQRPAKKPTASDQRQMFAYAHTYPDHPRISQKDAKVECWLVYPKFKWCPRSATERRTEDLKSATGAKLVCIEAPFPQPEDTRSQGSWNRQMTKMREQIRDVIK